MKTLILAFTLTLSSFAAAPPQFGAGSPAGFAQIAPQAMPTAQTIVAATDAYLQSITITNTTAAAITVTVADRQAAPVAVLSSVSIAANTTYVVVFSAYWCPNGFTVQASGAGLNYHANWRQ